MKRALATATLACLMVFGLFSSQGISADKIKEEVTVIPGKPLTIAEQNMISSMAVKVLKHIARARGYIQDKNFNEAGNEIQKAKNLIEMIKSGLPTTRIKDHIWVAKKHLQYESTEKVIPDLIPIYTSLEAIKDFVPVEEVKAHVDAAKKALKKGDKEEAGKKLELAAEGIVYVEVDLPLRHTERKIIEAERLLAGGEAEKADKILDEAEEGVQVISVAVYEPIVLAERSLWLAARDYAKDKYAAAGDGLHRAKEYMKKAYVDADEKTKKEIQELDKKIDSLGAKMKDGARGLSKDLKEAWSKSREIFKKTVDRFNDKPK